MSLLSKLRSVLSRGEEDNFYEKMLLAASYGERQRQLSEEEQKRVLDQRDWRNTSVQERFGAIRADERKQ